MITQRDDSEGSISSGFALEPLGGDCKMLVRDRHL